MYLVDNGEIPSESLLLPPLLHPHVFLNPIQLALDGPPGGPLPPHLGGRVGTGHPAIDSPLRALGEVKGFLRRRTGLHAEGGEE